MIVDLGLLHGFRVKMDRLQSGVVLPSSVPCGLNFDVIRLCNDFVILCTDNRLILFVQIIADQRIDRYDACNQKKYHSAGNQKDSFHHIDSFMQRAAPKDSPCNSD